MKNDKRLWIQELTFDALENRVRLTLTSDPDHSTIVREVIISKITKFQVERYHDPGAICLGDFLGLEIRPAEACWHYALDTGDARIEFEAQEQVGL